jgi:hypothetical protein
MAEDNINPELEAAVERTSGLKTVEAPVEEAGPMYRVFKDAKIPVSKQLGKLWKSRIDQAVASRGDIETCWSEAIRYYENDQQEHRNGSQGRSGNRRFQRTLTDKWSETENVVFSNACTMLPMLYAKNPQVEITAVNTALNEEFATCCEKLVNTLISMKTAPGLNFKNKGRRGVLWALLTNNAYSKVDFVNKEASSEECIRELEQLSEDYAKAKTKKEIKEIEGKLMALEEKVSILNPSGPKVTLTNPFRLLWDPQAIEPDHSDAMWSAEYDFLPTDYINAVYGKKSEDSNKIVSVYEPTHVLNSSASAEGIEDDVNNFTLFAKDKDSHAKSYGYDSEETYKKACYTKVWWIWDKTTRRLFLYADNKWEWPLWVWDDPLKLIEFFPYDHLWFHETVEGSQPKGEVTYYLDQQDAINDINSQIAIARNWARMNVFFDTNTLNQQAAEEVLKGPDGTARGIDVPEGKSLKDCIQSMVPPALSHPELFSTETKFASINRITGISEAQRGAQFKTNTTNEAIDFYQKNVDIRVDEKIDAIEDWIGIIAWKILQLCARNWKVEDVAAIIGEEAARPWAQLTDPNDLRTKLLVRVVGGSTDKPTSKNKKRAALEIGQVLGQFANAIPAAGLVTLKVFERAFADDIVITQEDWGVIHQSMEAATQKAGAGPGGAEAAPAEAGQEEITPEQEEQVRNMIAALPPEAKAQMQQLVQQGVPPSEALAQVSQGSQTRQ